MTLAKISKVLQTSSFKKAAKKLRKDQKGALDGAVKALIENPLLGEQKKGDLFFVCVYKFKMIKQLRLFGYSQDNGTVVLERLNFGSHENFTAMLKLF